MSCENKLTNLVFKNRENSARTQCASFSFLPFIYIYIYIYRIKKTPRMKCNAAPRDKRKETQKPKSKDQWSQRKNNEAQGPRKPRQIRDTESHQLLDEESQT